LPLSKVSTPASLSGLYAGEPIDAEDFVVEYIGEYVRNALADFRERKYRKLGYGDDYIFR